MTETYSDDYLLSLPSIPAPASVAAVAGCTCGGSIDLHREDCGIWALPASEALAAIDDTHRRVREHCDAVNRQLAAALERRGGAEPPTP